MAYLPLADLPHPLCEVERAARGRATEDSGYEIVYRSGFHGRPAAGPRATRPPWERWRRSRRPSGTPAA